MKAILVYSKTQRDLKVYTGEKVYTYKNIHESTIQEIVSRFKKWERLSVFVRIEKNGRDYTYANDPTGVFWYSIDQNGEVRHETEREEFRRILKVYQERNINPKNKYL